MIDYQPGSQDYDSYQKLKLKQAKRKKIFYISIAFVAVIIHAVVISQVITNKKNQKEVATVTRSELDSARQGIKKKSVIEKLEKQIEKEDAEKSGTKAVLEADAETQTDLSAPEPPLERQTLSESLDIAFRKLELSPEDQAIEAKLAEETIANFSAAITPEEKAAYVRNPERVLPLMRRYYSRNGNYSPYESEEVMEKGFFLIGDKKYVIFQYTRNPSSKNSPFISLAYEGDGTYKIDWESMVGHGEMGWEEFLKIRPSEPTLFRCIAENGDFYNFSFVDPEKWACFTLYRPYSLDTIYGYAERGTDLEKRLRRALVIVPRITVILRLSIPEDSKGQRLVQIDELVQETWLVPN